MVLFALAFNMVTACADPVADESIQDTEQTDDDGEKPGEDGTEPEPEPEPKPVPGTEDDGIVKILAIGNSFSQDAVEQYLWELYDAAGIKAVIANLYIGGCRLDTHYNNAQNNNPAYAYRKITAGSSSKTEQGNFTLLKGIEDENWDFISLQQASGSSGQYETYTTYLPGLIDYVQEHATNPDMKIAFHQTWAYPSTSNHGEFPKYDSDQMIMYNAIMDAVQQAVRDNPEIEYVIPSGTAIQNARNTYMGDTFNRDGNHLNVYYGRYTASCTWFETFTGQSPVGIGYVPDGVDPYQATIAQNAAHFACQDKYAVNPMTDFQSPDITSDGDTPIYVDFGSSSPSDWNNVPVYRLAEGQTIFFKDAKGAYTSVKISGLEGFTDVYDARGGEPDDMDFEAGDITWPRNVWVDGIMVSKEKNTGDAGPATITLSGLDPARTYTFDILSTRWNGSENARKTEVTITGATTSETQTLKQGIGNGNNQVLKNDNHARFTMTPNASGEVAISILGVDTGSAADGLISAMVISM